jgi:hypothetical protein
VNNSLRLPLHLDLTFLVAFDSFCGAFQEVESVLKSVSGFESGLIMAWRNAGTQDILEPLEFFA